MIPDWLYVSQLNGHSGTTIITISAIENTSTNELNTALVVNNGQFKNVRIMQLSGSGESSGETYYKGQYLTFTILSSGYINWYRSSSSVYRTIEYSTDDGNTWNSITSSTAGTKINVSTGDIVKVRGNNEHYGIREGELNGTYGSFSGSTAGFKVSGNIMSLVNNTGFTSADTITKSYAFSYLFSNCTGLTDASNLQLSATGLTPCCYSYLFQGCTNLTKVPKLRAKDLTAGEFADDGGWSKGWSCYEKMFQGCTSLTTAPSLPAMTLSIGCYNAMFYGCSNLTVPPMLPAVNLANACYAWMFGNCTSLITAPVLPATILEENCYEYLFDGCSSLNYIRCYANDISAEFCTSVWTRNVASSGIFVNAGGASWTSGTSGIPEGWTVQ